MRVWIVAWTLMILAAQSSTVVGRTCAVVYDTDPDVRGTFLSEVSEFVNDSSCAAIIFFPPVTALGGISPTTGIQKIALDSDKRKSLDLFLKTEDFAADARKFNFGGTTIEAFNHQIAKTENVSKMIFSVHGRPGIIRVNSKLTVDERGKIFAQPRISAADILSLANGDEPAAKRIEERLGAADDSGTFANACKQTYDKMESMNGKTFVIRPRLKRESEALAKTYEDLGDLSADPERRAKACPVFEKAVRILNQFYNGSKRNKKFCRQVFDYGKSEENALECANKYFSDNLLDHRLLSGLAANGELLLTPCVLGKEEPGVLDDRVMHALQGCPQLDEYVDLLKHNRRGAELSTASKLCVGAKSGATFTVAQEITYSFRPPVLESNSEAENNLPKFVDPVDNIFNEQVQLCDPDLYKTYADGVKLIHDLQSAERSEDGLGTHLKSVETSARLESFACDPKLTLSDAEKQSLKEELILSHRQRILTSFFLRYQNLGVYGRPTSTFSLQSLYKTLASALVPDLDLVAKQYENLNLDTRAAQIAAMQRLEFLQKSLQRGFGFFDCYRCSADGVPEKIKCDGLRTSFASISDIGTPEDFELLKNPEVFLHKLEVAAKTAETQDLPFCHLKIPSCKFGTGDCGTQSPHTEK